MEPQETYVTLRYRIRHRVGTLYWFSKYKRITVPIETTMDEIRDQIYAMEPDPNAMIKNLKLMCTIS